jgi:hypothetical protein
VVARYRLLNHEAAKEAQERGEKEWPRIPSHAADPNYKGKGLQLEFTVEGDGVLTMPWTATITYRRPVMRDESMVSWSVSIVTRN